MERIKEMIVEGRAEDGGYYAFRLSDKSVKEITTYLIGEVEKLRHSNINLGYQGVLMGLRPDLDIQYNQALEDVEKMLKGEK